jgi:sulfur transfer protein SufE
MGKVRKCQCSKAKEASNKVHCCKDTVKFVKVQDVHAPQFAPDQKKQSHSTSVELLNYAITENNFSVNTLASIGLMPLLSMGRQNGVANLISRIKSL